MEIGEGCLLNREGFHAPFHLPQKRKKQVKLLKIFNWRILKVPLRLEHLNNYEHNYECNYDKNNPALVQVYLWHD